MPGILGIFETPPKQGNGEALRQMLQSMTREDFYRVGTYVNEDLGIWIGWSWHSNSHVDHLPAWNDAGDVCLIMVGEEFSHHGMPNGATDGWDQAHERHPMVGPILKQYDDVGTDCLRGLNGWFTGVIVDLRRKRVILFNDRYGLLRLHYHQTDRGLYFASEAKALVKVLPRTRAIDPRSLGEFLSLGCVLQNRTLFAEVSLLPGGSAWTFAPQEGIRRGAYFDRSEWEIAEPLPEHEYYDKLRNTWISVLPRYFDGQRKVGLSMTGGLDSRMILAWAKQGPGTLPCYTFGGPRRECRDVRLAREVADICHQPHRVLNVDDRFLQQFPDLAKKAVLISDGAMDVTGAVDIYVQRLAREVAPVRLTGVNGGELFRNVVNFKPRPLNQGLFSRDAVEFGTVAAATYVQEAGGHPTSFVAFKQAPWFMTAKFSIEHSQLIFRTPYFDNDLVRLAYERPRSWLDSQAPALRLVEEGNPALARIGTDRGVMTGGTPGATRVQNLIQEFTFKAEYAYDYGMPHWLAAIDRLFAPMHLERLFLGRHKIHHFRISYRDELADYVREMLLDRRSIDRWYVNGDFLKMAVQGHTRGHQNYTTEIHKLLSCELIHRHLIEQE